MRDINQRWFREQVSVLKRQFLQEGDLPFTRVLSEKTIAPAPPSPATEVDHWRPAGLFHPSPTSKQQAPRSNHRQRRCMILDSAPASPQMMSRKTSARRQWMAKIMLQKSE